MEGDFKLDQWLIQPKLNQAIAEDSNYARAHCGLAANYWHFGHLGFLPPSQVMLLAKTAVLRSLELDEYQPESHAMLGMLNATYDFDWRAAEREFHRSLDMDPKSPVARVRYAFFFLRPMGRLDEAASEAQRALDMDDSLSLIFHFPVAYLFYMTQQYDRAIEQCRNALELAPDYYMGNWLLGMIYAMQQKFAEAVAVHEKAVELADRNAAMVGTLGRTYALAGRADEARELLAELQALISETYIPPTSLAWINLGLGRIDQAFEWLEKALAERDSAVIGLNTEPMYQGLHSDPRYTEMLRRMNLAT